ncbi:hypothetical protein BUALT_Bualt17G0030700 [Buddleja alternifolia]|uniref:Sieve element occlusion n=1 Tax=Buddleja alternifolia TaxID=168488 RepID=A0AAV6WDG1_9LAMI|nr:hypothetical protein BUALT_Bualt17G0030700 [Buddleja alternifolia]
MTSRDVVPATMSHPLTSENAPLSHAKPHLPGGVHNFAADHSLRQGHELDHSTVRPLPHNPPVHGTGRGHMTRRAGDRSFFSSDDNALAKQIIATHATEIEELNMKPVLSIVEDILRRGRPLTADVTHGAPHAHLDTVDEKLLHSTHHDDKVLHGPYHDDKLYHSHEIDHGHDPDIVKLLAFPISKISCEITGKCAAGGEAHSVTMDLLKSLSNYSWDAKVVITFAAFAISYGEFYLVEQLHTKNPLAKNIAILKDLPDMLTHGEELKKKLEAVQDLLNAVLKATHSIIEFKELPTAYISHDTPEMAAATAHIPTAVYWIIRSLLACASVLLNLIGSGHEYITSTSESWEILSLAHKLSVIMEHLQRQLALCKDLIETKKGEDAYIAFKRLMETSHIDNMRVLRAMIRGKEDQRPLYDGSRRTNERIEALRMKYVLLLISDLDVPHEELNVLHLIYNQQARRHEYEVLWLPILNHASSTSSLHDPVFYDLRNNHMPWYSVDHLSLVEPVAIRYIREVWKFVHMPMLVVLDPQGKLSNLDALPMMWIWGSNAFPFTKLRETDLWADVTSWNIELLADAIDARIPDWINQNRVICLYGGEDIEWIRKFTHSAREAAVSLGVPLEMLYVGKRNPKDKVRRCHEIIDREKLSHIFSLKDYYDYVWYFWVRLWSMWNSKKHIGMSVDNDPIMQEIMDLLTYDSTEEGWAVFSRGNFEMTKGKGNVVQPVLGNFASWGHKVDHPDRFVSVLDEEIKGSQPEHHCNRLILPGQSGYIPERIVCSECGKPMDKYVMYRCCTD